MGCGTHLTVRDAPSVPGARYNEKVIKALEKISNPILQSGRMPPLIWGECAMTYYGIPTVEFFIKIILPEEDIEPVKDLLLSSGFASTQPGVYDPDLRYLGSTVYHLQPADDEIEALFATSGLPSTIVLMDFSIGGSFFKSQDLRTFVNVGGILIPPLPVLAYSFVRACLGMKTNVRYKQRPFTLRQLLRVWISYVKYYGYSPLRAGEINAPGFDVDEAAKQLWEDF